MQDEVFPVVVSRMVVRQFARSDDKPERRCIVEISPYPVDQNGDFVAHAQQRQQMHSHPCHPRRETAQMDFAHVYNGPVAADCGH